MNDEGYRDDRDALLRELKTAREQLARGCSECTARTKDWHLYLSRIRSFGLVMLPAAAVLVALVYINALLFDASAAIKAAFVTFDVCFGISLIIWVIVTAVYWDSPPSKHR